MMGITNYMWSSKIQVYRNENSSKNKYNKKNLTLIGTETKLVIQTYRYERVAKISHPMSKNTKIVRN